MLYSPCDRPYFIVLIGGIRRYVEVDASRSAVSALLLCDRSVLFVGLPGCVGLGDYVPKLNLACAVCCVLRQYVPVTAEGEDITALSLLKLLPYCDELLVVVLIKLHENVIPLKEISGFTSL